MKVTPDEGNVFDAVPPPQDAPPPPPSGPTPRAPRKKRQIGKGCLSLLVIGFVLTLGGCTTVLLLASLGAVGDPVRDTDAVVSEGGEDEGNDEAADLDPFAEADNTDSAPEALASDASPTLDTSGGTREAPYAFNEATTIEFDVFGDADGSRWNVTLAPLTDVTAAVVGENGFNEPPPADVVFAGFVADMTLISANKEPLSVGFNFTWEILGGSTAAVYDLTTIDTDAFGCGVTPNDYPDFAEAYVGGTISGLVCIPLPVDDLEHPKTQVALNFRGDRIHFANDGVPGTALPTPAVASRFPSGDRLGTREEPYAYGEVTDIQFESFGDADRSRWAIQVDQLGDVGERVLASNQFNEPPPEGVVYAGFEADMTLLGAGKEPLSPGFNYSWEVIGGATARAYGVATLDTSFIGCGVTDGSFDMFSEVFVTGSISGLVCIPIPTKDLGHPNTRIAMNFTDGDRIHFGG